MELILYNKFVRDRTEIITKYYIIKNIQHCLLINLKNNFKT